MAGEVRCGPVIWDKYSHQLHKQNVGVFLLGVIQVVVVADADFLPGGVEGAMSGCRRGPGGRARISRDFLTCGFAAHRGFPRGRWVFAGRLPGRYCRGSWSATRPTQNAPRCAAGLRVVRWDGGGRGVLPWLAQVLGPLLDLGDGRPALEPVNVGPGHVSLADFHPVVGGQCPRMLPDFRAGSAGVPLQLCHGYLDLRVPLAEPGQQQPELDGTGRYEALHQAHGHDQVLVIWERDRRVWRGREGWHVVGQFGLLSAARCGHDS